MEIVNLIQGSTEWLAHRRAHFNASDAPAMMGVSPHKTRAQLVREYATGITPDVDAGTQRLFDAGHRFEALARPLAEAIIGEELAPLTGKNGNFSASFDGMNMDGTIIFEHKTLNREIREALDCGGSDVLPIHYKIQMEHQLMVSGANMCLFMATEWRGDQCAEKRHCHYTPDPEIRAAIVKGWRQFEKDVAAYVPEEVVAPAAAQPLESLPVVSIRVDGELTIAGNLEAFGDALQAFVKRIPESPSTDQEFADTEAACRALKKAEEALDQGETAALASLSNVQEMRRFIADFRNLARTTRLAKEKLVTSRKEEIKREIVAKAVKKLGNAVASVNAELHLQALRDCNAFGLPYADIAEAIKGKKTVQSLRDAADQALANGLIAIGDLAKRCHNNAAVSLSGIEHLFPDMERLLSKTEEDFKAIVAQRRATHEHHLEQERQRIREEEERKSAQAAKAAQPVAAAEPVAAIAPPAVIPFTPFRGEVNGKIDSFPSINLGQINTLLHVVTVTAIQLEAMGFKPHSTVGASKMYLASDMSMIANCIASRMNYLAQQGIAQQTKG
jgi:putative phage-type endonuclease